MVKTKKLKKESIKSLKNKYNILHDKFFTLEVKMNRNSKYTPLQLKISEEMDAIEKIIKQKKYEPKINITTENCKDKTRK